MTAFTATENSTTGRSNHRPSRASLALRALEAVSPGLAARVSAHVMFRTARRPPEAWEDELIRSAESLTLSGPRGPLAVKRWGAGPLVLLMHGWNGRGSQLGAFVPPLVATGHQVVAFDAPGHGSSAGSDSTVVEFAEAFDLVADAVRPFFQPVRAIVAHSLGGPAVMLALCRWLERRGATEGPAVDEALERTRLVFIAPPIDMRDVTQGFVDSLGLGGSTLVHLDNVAAKRLGRPLGELYAPHVARRMRSPLLVLHDAHDRAVPVSSGHLLAAAWPGARLRVTHGLGHSRILRDAESVREAVDFILETNPG